MIYTVYDDLTETPKTLSADGPSLPEYDIWYRISFSFIRIGYSSTAKVFVDGTSGSSFTLSHTYLHDKESYLFKLGSSVLHDGDMRGIVY